MAEIDLTLLVTAHGGARLATFLEGVAREGAAGLAWEIVVLGSAGIEPASARAGAPARVAFLREGGLDRALEEARGGLVVFADDFVEPGPGWLRGHLGAAARWPSCAAFAGPVLPRLPAGAPEWLGGHPVAVAAFGIFAPELLEAVLPRNLLPSPANFAARARALRGVGPGAGERTEIVRRLRDRGERVAFVPSARVARPIEEEEIAAARLFPEALRRGRALARAEPDTFTPRLFGAPRHLWKAAAKERASYAAGCLRGRAARLRAGLLLHETRGKIREYREVAARPARAECAIFMYHYVLEDEPAAFGLPCCYRLRGTAVTPELLRAQLSRVRRFVTLDEIARALEEGRPPPTGVALTFDDGHANVVGGALPVLRALGAPATCFVNARFEKEAPRAFAIDAFFWLLDHARERELEIRLPDGRTVAGSLASVEGKRALAGGPIHQLLKTWLPLEVRDAILGGVAAATGAALPADLAARLYLDAEGRARLAAGGVRLGAHGASHAALPELDDPTLEEEVAASVARVAALERGPVAFAYPFGEHDERARAAVARAGASCAVTASGGFVGADADRLRLPRFPITSETRPEKMPLPQGGRSAR